MTTKPRELSVDRYNFYSTKETPLPDEKVAALHGMSPDELEDWKVKNGLIGAPAAPVEKKAPIKQVSIQDDTEALTVELYEQYKKADEPLSDGTICKKHGMSAADMQKFKRQHDLIGKFNAHKPGKAIEIKPQVDVFAKKPVSNAGMDISKAFQEVGNSLKQAFFPEREEVKPLSEKAIAKERLAQTINSFQASKEEPAVGSLSVGDPSVQPMNSSSPSGWSVAPAGMQKVEVPESVELKLLQSEFDQVKAKLAERDTHIASLEERHVKDGAYIDEIKKDRYDIIARADNWRDKCRLTENELRDKVCEIDKLKEQHYIEIINLQNDLHKAKEVNELLRQDEQLLFLTMKKLVNVNDRAAVSVEGEGRNIWI